ncbi:MAG: hypothetical protein PHP62_01865 [Candidatus Moranbacteria bacterium]|nr:hypothetical protein [Candidatus Moranbacteria bacterium]
MTASRRQFFRTSKSIAREMGVNGKAFRFFLLNCPKSSLNCLNKDEIRRSLKYVNEAMLRKEHTSVVPYLLMIN